MAIGVKVCKVCGKEYEACHTLRPNLGSEFRWQDVACCPAHGAEYLRQVMIARGEAEPEHTAAEAETTVRTVKKRQRKKDAVKAEEAAVAE